MRGAVGCGCRRRVWGCVPKEQVEMDGRNEADHQEKEEEDGTTTTTTHRTAGAIKKTKKAGSDENPGCLPTYLLISESRRGRRGKGKSKGTWKGERRGQADLCCALAVLKFGQVTSCLPTVLPSLALRFYGRIGWRCRS